MSNILVVDDDTATRRLLESVLTKAGFSVVVAVDGSEGVNHLRSRAFDLVFLDVWMPQMNGLEVLRNLAGGGGHWILLSVRESSGRDALGATVEFALARGLVRREVQSAASYLSANDPRIHLGLARETEVQHATVRWVDGAREVFGPLACDQVHDLRRGSGSPAD